MLKPINSHGCGYFNMYTMGYVMLIHSVGRSFLRLVSFFCLVSSDVFEIVFSVLLDCYGLIMCCTDWKTVVSS